MGVIDTTNRRSPGRSFSLARAAEAVAWTIGVVLVAGSAVAYVDGVRGRQQAMDRFAEMTAVAQPHDGTVDLTDWSAARIKAWPSTRDLPSAAPLAVLRIPRVRLEVPVLEGTDEITLNRALGHIEGTALPGTDGNAGIAGHRDGFFRSLKDVVAGDVIELETPLRGKATYRIERIRIVAPEEVWVLDPTPARSLTLVTCYPFYFVGSAPERYIVRAVLAETDEDARDPRMSRSSVERTPGAAPKASIVSPAPASR